MIGIFNDNFPPVFDGVALTAKNYADCLYSKGKDVSVITPYSPGIAETPYPIYTYQSLPLVARKPYRLGLPLTDYAFRMQLSQLKFQIVHAHCPFTSGRLALKIAKKQNIPLVATFHSKYRQDLEHSFRTKLAVDMAIKYIISFYEKAYEVWIPQAAVEPTLREYGYKGKVTVVDNGNDLVTTDDIRERFRRETRHTLGINENEIMLLFVGQHIWEKNIGFILDSLALIPNMPYHLYMVGTGYAVSGIRKKIIKSGLDDKVTLLGVVREREQLQRYYSAADLFLFPSIYDNAPLVVREAAALHTPAAMLAGSTASEIIRDGQNGFLTPNDVNAYAQLIVHLIEHPEELRKVGDNAAQTLTRSWDNVVDEVIERYADICERFAKRG